MPTDKVRRGEHDLLFISRSHGVLIVSIKSVGGNFDGKYSSFFLFDVDYIMHTTVPGSGVLMATVSGKYCTMERGMTFCTHVL